MGKRKSQKENERFRSWTQHIYQRFSSVLDDIELDDRSRVDLPDFTGMAFTDVEKEPLIVNSVESRSDRSGRVFRSPERAVAEKPARRRS